MNRPDSMLLDNTLVLAKSLVNGVTITQDEVPEEIHYYLLEFEQHDCVLAQGSWSESFADGPGLRAKFQNAAEFHALYPDYRTPDELTLCAPRPERGKELGAVLRPVVARAAAQVLPGALRGVIDRIEASGLVEGWAQDMANPHLPVLLEVFRGDERIGTVLACDYRKDLEAAGIGRGHCMFSFIAPPGMISPANRAAIRVCRAGEGAEIFASDDYRARTGIMLHRKQA